MKPTIIHSKSFVKDAVDLILDKANAKLEGRGRFLLGLCGGRTAEPVYAELAERGKTLDWDRITMTFSDERCVGPEHADSNFGMAKRSLFEDIEIPPENIFRIHGEEPPDSAASSYEKSIVHLAEGDILSHNLLLLGVGEDGHTASLFPGTKALAERTRLVVPNFVPKQNSWRITFTYPLINASRHIIFLVNHKEKKRTIDAILNGDSSYPAAGVSATESVTWLLGF